MIKQNLKTLHIEQTMVLGGGDLQKASRCLEGRHLWTFTDSQGTNRPEPPKPIPHRLLLLSRPQGANELPEDLYP